MIRLCKQINSKILNNIYINRVSGSILYVSHPFFRQDLFEITLFFRVKELILITPIIQVSHIMNDFFRPINRLWAKFHER